MEDKHRLRRRVNSVSSGSDTDSVYLSQIPDHAPMVDMQPTASPTFTNLHITDNYLDEEGLREGLPADRLPVQQTGGLYGHVGHVMLPVGAPFRTMDYDSVSSLQDIDMEPTFDRSILDLERGNA